jgi:hypothetical protein
MLWVLNCRDGTLLGLGGGCDGPGVPLDPADTKEKLTHIFCVCFQLAPQIDSDFLTEKRGQMQRFTRSSSG